MNRIRSLAFALLVLFCITPSARAQSIVHDTYDIYQQPAGSGKYYVAPTGTYDVATNHTFDHIRVELYHKAANGTKTSLGAGFFVDPCPIGMRLPSTKTWTAGTWGQLPKTPAGSTLHCRATLYYNIGGGVILNTYYDKQLTSVP